MAEASISVDQDKFKFPVCLDLLKDPVTIPCGHSFCKVCINGCWDQEDQKGVYSCPQRRHTFTPRPVLRRNTMLAEVVEKLKKTELQAASPAHCYAGPGDVECDFCIFKRKYKAVKSCLMCAASLCEIHLKHHLELPALKKHTVIEASAELQEKICSQHDEVPEIYCRTDQTCICYLCMMDNHKGHDTVTAAAERAEKQSELKEEQMKCQQRIREKQKKVQEIADLQRRVTELEELSQTHDHIHFLQALASERQSPPIERPDFRTSSIHQHLSFDGVRNSLSGLKKFEEFCEEEFSKIPPQVEDVQILPSDLQSRDEFLKYFRCLTLDPNTAHCNLIPSEKNRVVRYTKIDQQYSDHPDRFDYWPQVLCKESVCGRCYWEVEWESDGGVAISVSYKGISRKGPGNECMLSRSSQSWSLEYVSSSSLSFWHNSIVTELSVPSSSRIGVYVDHSAGTLSFYSVSDMMTLLHRVYITFTQPLYAGIGFYKDWWSKSAPTVRLCDPK